MPSCPHCGHTITSDELGDLLIGLGTAAPPVLSGGTTAGAGSPVQVYQTTTIDVPLGPADARGPEAADPDTPVFGL